ncbi:hypothetical protein WOLCODRAFT_116915 [Wolfiporia cocos MD-104 SS10]|uniref:Uncharacterized protein n=1 Tax=Wolfiporia cocos (strain MD-104) TaxID=742152 RepID=A0A2H3JDE4_WOLCO|nr:hypothetical protein WOLCODRAFT_116915 [Wolfiporia cocos MD-104 SS10]
MMGLPPAVPEPKVEQPLNEVSSWYRSLTRGVNAPTSRTHPASPHRPSSTDALPQDAATSTDPAPSLPLGSPSPSGPSSTPRGRENRTKKDWFISRALRSEPPPQPAPTHTLADILSRDPPQERPYTPPVFLAIGPSNRGFAMLQQSGWSEGEPLGAGVARRSKPSEGRPRARVEREEDTGRVVVKEEEREVQCDSDGDVREIRKVDVIDLTLSDEDDEDEIEVGATADAPSSSEPPSHNPRALLTPLPTVLKSDRLGVGLKAKTVGPYKASKKRVTHNAAALAAHIREAEEMRRMKKLVGRGTRGFARLAKAETEARQRLLASLNAG